MDKSDRKGFASLFRRKKQADKAVEEEVLQEEKKEESKDTTDIPEIDPRINIDGHCRFKLNDQGIFLKLFLPMGKGKPLELEAIKKEAAKKEFVDLDWELVAEKLTEGFIDWFLVAARNKELDRDSSISIEITNNEMAAYLDYRPPLGGRFLTVPELLEAVKAAGVVYGIKEETLSTVEKSKWSMQKLLVAEGSTPQGGTDGLVEYHVSVRDQTQPGRVRQDGSIDYYDLSFVQSVKAGQILASLRPPIPGIPGYKVTGEEIPAPPTKEARLPNGKNTEFNENEDELLSTIDGQVLVEGGRLSVVPIFQHKGDVDLSTGHIDFLGSVIIEGNVAEGLQVKAGGDVTVTGHLDAATIISEGNVTINKGFRGKNKGKIEAKGDVSVKFVENGIIEVRGNLFVGEALMHSRVKAGGKVVVDGKGLIVGGFIHSGGNIDAKTIGSGLATKTEIKVGVDPVLLEEEEVKLNKQHEVTDNLEKLQKAISMLAEQESKGLLSPDRLEQLNKLRETRELLIVEERELAESLEEIKNSITSMQHGVIYVRQKLFPGVRVSIANSNYIVKDERGRSKMIYDNGEVVFTVM